MARSPKIHRVTIANTGDDADGIKRRAGLGEQARWQMGKNGGSARGLQGLAAGERVMVEGSQRARVGDTVKASEVVPPAPGRKGSAAPASPAASAAPAAAASAPAAR